MIGLACLALAGCQAAPTTLAGQASLAAPTRAPSPAASPTIPAAVSPTASPMPARAATATGLPPTPSPSSTPLPTLTPTALSGQPATAAAAVLDVWDNPAHEHAYWSRETQLIAGERVLVLAEKGDWAQIVAVEQPSHKDPRGYPGWVRASGLVNGWSQAQAYAVVMVSRALARGQPDGKASVLMGLSIDSRLPLAKVDQGWAQVTLPDGRPAWIAAADIRSTGDPQAPAALDGFFATAQSLTGVPYLWGGTADGALDCAGFIYRLYHAYGITLPRDADDQARAGEDASGQALKRGDLIFTAESKGGAVTHVVMAWGDGMVIDEDTPQGLTVRPLSAALRSSYLVTVRRYLP